MTTNRDAGGLAGPQAEVFLGQRGGHELGEAVWSAGENRDVERGEMADVGGIVPRLAFVAPASPAFSGSLLTSRRLAALATVLPYAGCFAACKVSARCWLASSKRSSGRVWLLPFSIASVTLPSTKLMMRA